MSNETNRKHKVLITDDSEMNRAILSEMLSDEFDIMEAKNGMEAVTILQEYHREISVLLLDIVMPEMDGFEVLAYMNKYNWINDIPVIMISAEDSPQHIKCAYDLGASDYINRPFDISIVHRRVTNTIMLYDKQRRLVGLVTDQIYAKEKSNNLMISILSHIVEFRNGESGMHVLHVRRITEILLETIMKKNNNKYKLTKSDISLISIASALHDIGKISIPDEIINKPGRFTKEEFEIMKGHSMAGAEMLDGMTSYKNEPLVKRAYEICRWHHERYDGRGYPDGLKGDEIPISAQAVAIADVYDALTSERCYKKAFTHEKAIEMIFNGECGTFNPELLECFKEASDTIRDELKINSISLDSKKEMRHVADELYRHEDLQTPDSLAAMLAIEYEKTDFFASSTDDILCSYTKDPAMYKLSKRSAERLGVEDTMLEPGHELLVRAFPDEAEHKKLTEVLTKADYQNPDFSLELDMNLGGKLKHVLCIGRKLWGVKHPEEDCAGIIFRIKEQ